MISVFTLLYEIHNCSSESATPSIPAPDMDELMLTISLLKCIWHMINDVDHQLDFWWDCAQVRGFWGTLDFASSEKYNAPRRMTTTTTFLNLIMTRSTLSEIFLRDLYVDNHICREGEFYTALKLSQRRVHLFDWRVNLEKPFIYMIIEKNIKNRLPQSA